MARITILYEAGILRHRKHP